MPNTPTDQTLWDSALGAPLGERLDCARPEGDTIPSLDDRDDFATGMDLDTIPELRQVRADLVAEATRPHQGTLLNRAWASTALAAAPVFNDRPHLGGLSNSTTAAAAAAAASRSGQNPRGTSAGYAPASSAHGRLPRQAPLSSAPAGFHSATAAWADHGTQYSHSSDGEWASHLPEAPKHYPHPRGSGLGTVWPEPVFSTHELAKDAYNGAFYVVQRELEQQTGDDINLIPLKIFTYGFQPVVLALVITGTAVALCVFAPAAMTTIGFGLLSLVKVSASAEIAKIVGACLLATNAIFVVKPVINEACEFSYTKIVSSYFNRLLDQSLPTPPAEPPVSVSASLGGGGGAGGITYHGQSDDDTYTRSAGVTLNSRFI